MSIKETADVIIKAIKEGRCVYVIGNGGSATMATHFAGELWKFPVIALTNLATITAIANDLNYKYIFSKQIEGLGKRGDVLITLSTSGESKNILEAIKVAEKMGLVVVKFPTKKEFGVDTGTTQEYHLYIIHQVCELIEEAFR